MHKQSTSETRRALSHRSLLQMTAFKPLGKHPSCCRRFERCCLFPTAAWCFLFLCAVLLALATSGVVLYLTVDWGALQERVMESLGDMVKNKTEEAVAEEASTVLPW